MSSFRRVVYFLIVFAIVLSIIGFLGVLINERGHLVAVNKKLLLASEVQSIVNDFQKKFSFDKFITSLGEEYMDKNDPLNGWKNVSGGDTLIAQESIEISNCQNLQNRAIILFTEPNPSGQLNSLYKRTVTSDETSCINSSLVTTCPISLEDSCLQFDQLISPAVKIFEVTYPNYDLASDTLGRLAIVSIVFGDESDSELVLEPVNILLRSMN